MIGVTSDCETFTYKMLNIHALSGGKNKKINIGVDRDSIIYEFIIQLLIFSIAVAIWQGAG